MANRNGKLILRTLKNISASIEVDGGGSNLIHFTIRGLGEFTAEKYMTWVNFIESKYNTIRLYIDEEHGIITFGEEKQGAIYNLIKKGYEYTKSQIVDNTEYGYVNLLWQEELESYLQSLTQPTLYVSEFKQFLLNIGANLSQTIDTQMLFSLLGGSISIKVFEDDRDNINFWCLDHSERYSVAGSYPTLEEFLDSIIDSAIAINESRITYQDFDDLLLIINDVLYFNVSFDDIKLFIREGSSPK